MSTTTTTTTTTNVNTTGGRHSVAEPTTIVLVDPTSPDGEDALGRIGDDVEAVSLVVLLSGPLSASLREFAHAENTDLASAGWIYLDQVTARVARDGLIIETIVATGPDTAAELAVIADQRNAERILVPRSLHRIDPRATTRLERATTATVEVVELAIAP